jgi:hypothetical protein
VPPGVVAGQFGHQVLIQTATSWSYQRRIAARMLEEPGSPLYQVAAETGVPYIRYADSPGAVANPNSGVVLNYIYRWLDSVGRDVYHMAKPADYFGGHRAAAEAFLTRIDTLNLMTGVDVTGVSEMYASARAGAYKMKVAGSGGNGAGSVPSRPSTASRVAAVIGRHVDRGKIASPAGVAPGRLASRPDAARGQQTGYDFSALVGPPPDPGKLAVWPSAAGESDMAAVFGGLQPWDRYCIELNYDVASAFAYNKATLRNYPVQYNNSELYGRMFLETAAWVETFMTDSAWDSVVYSPAVPEALALHTDILSAAQLDSTGPPGAARPGQILCSYRAGAVPGSSAVGRTIRFPGYLLSGHAVTLTESTEILDDVIEWLAATGIPARGR